MTEWPITYEQNFDLDKSRQHFFNGLKEHHKISNISLRNVVKCGYFVMLFQAVVKCLSRLV